jgi:lactoylglutathione lyase
VEKTKTKFKNGWPYQKDKLNLPVPDLDAAIPYYESILGFRIVSRNNAPYKSAIMERDDVQIGFAENGGDPTQDGCFFEVENAETAFAELKANGLDRDDPKFDVHTHGDTRWKVFFLVAPDGLCYCLGERLFQ